MRYSEFRSIYNILVTLKEFAIVMDAIPKGALMLLSADLRRHQNRKNMSLIWPFNPEQKNQITFSERHCHHPLCNPLLGKVCL